MKKDDYNGTYLFMFILSTEFKISNLFYDDHDICNIN